jgi:multiple sugar transport system permease protein
MSGRQGPWFVLPAILILAAFVVYPIAETIVLSLTDQSGAYVGLANYREVVESSTTTRAANNTLYYVLMSILFELILGIAAGILLNQRFRGRGAVRSTMLIPWVIPDIVAATAWAWMYHTDFGVINQLLQMTGLQHEPVGWLTQPNTVMPALVAVHVWKVFPFVAIMILAGLQSIPTSLYEAARVDGATFWHEVRHIMLPALRTTIAAITLLLLVNGFNSITIVYAMTRGGPANRSLLTSIQIFKEAFEYSRFNQASALSIMFFIVVSAAIVAYVRWTAAHARADA